MVDVHPGDGGWFVSIAVRTSSQVSLNPDESQHALAWSIVGLVASHVFFCDQMFLLSRNDKIQHTSPHKP